MIYPSRAARKRRADRRARDEESGLRDPEYLEWCRTQPCAMCGAPGPSEASHMGDVTDGKGAGIKAPDSTAAPACPCCHRGWEQRRLPFPGMAKWERRAYAARLIAASRAKYLASKEAA